MLKIVSIPNPVLTSGTKKVEQFNSSLTKLVKDMDQTLRAQIDPQGVGLAAPQVGINKALFIVKPTPEAETEVFVNPRIITTSDERLSTIHPRGESLSKEHLGGVDSQEVIKNKKKPKKKLEGCLSIPKIWGPVDRAKKIHLEYQDLTGKKIKKWFSGFKATIIQHEADHLNGVLFTQRALEQNQQLFEEKDGELMPLRFQKEGVNT